MLHFVGFKGEEYLSALRVFGPPDFYHRQHDARMWTDVAPGDRVVFARGAENRFSEYAFNDSEHF